MADEEKVKGEIEGVELDDEVLEDVSGGENPKDSTPNDVNIIIVDPS
jgi:hypothetical protein